jgi:hypothetical protein
MAVRRLSLSLLHYSGTSNDEYRNRASIQPITQGYCKQCLTAARSVCSCRRGLDQCRNGVYIVAFYGGAAADGSLEQWNKHLPGLYEPGTSLATIGIAFHFITGAIVLALGPIQFFGPIRNNVPALHRWIGRLYTLAAVMAGIGGLTFIALKGTIGGASMNPGFSLYGALMLIGSVETIWNAWKRNFVQHRAWAIRLFALAIGSWLYRMDYGFWLSLTPGLGHTKTFDGPFDVVMSFFSSFRICLLRSSSSKTENQCAAGNNVDHCACPVRSSRPPGPRDILCHALPVGTRYSRPAGRRWFVMKSCRPAGPRGKGRMTRILCFAQDCLQALRQASKAERLVDDWKLIHRIVSFQHIPRVARGEQDLDARP